MKSVGVLLAATFGLILVLPLSAAGAPAPPLVGTDIMGRAITPETFKGRPVVVDFSSLFCSSCQETIKEFVRLEKAYKSTDKIHDGFASDLETVLGLKELAGLSSVVAR